MEKSYFVGDKLRKQIAEESSEIRLRHQSLGFIRTVQAVKGGLVADEIVNKLSEILGFDWGGQIIADLLADETEGHTTRIRVTTGKHDDKIRLIKAVRSVSGMGLKESKDAVDEFCTKFLEWKRQNGQRNGSYYNYFDVWDAPYLDLPLQQRLDSEGKFDNAWFSNVYAELKSASFRILG